MQTKVTTLLDQNNIPYQRLPHTEAVFTMEAAAAQRNVVPEEMLKSILLRDKDHKYVMACMLGYGQLDPKKVRALFQDGAFRRLTFASAEEITELTGYTKGAVAPFGLPDTIPLIIDHNITQLERINTSSGDHMLGIELATADLLTITKAQLADIQKS
ncbi:MAG: Cys-tRNA(Pro) deacylase [Cellvibrionaceae bacterium]|jgi:Cys-tRNA(Pro) deacylase